MERFLALKASAGSGKTFALTVRYIVLLLKGAKPSEILTLTFTNKAANEMNQRVYNTLLTLGEDEAYLDEIIKSSQLTKDEVLSRKYQLLNTFSNSTINIFTIDKFINKILREFCTYIAISDDFEIKNDDVELLSYKFLQSLNSKSFDDLIEFSIYESKKFNMVFELFNILLEKNENISLIELESTLINLQKDLVLSEAFKIKEYFKNCEKISNSGLKAVDFDRFDELFDKTWISKNSLSEYQYFKKYVNIEVEEIFSKLRVELEKYYKIRSAYSLNKIFKLYLEFKNFKLEFNKENNYFNFSDITNLVYELLNSKIINRDFLYFRLDSTYNHILIDEFQDTSTLQYKILAPLIDEILSKDDDVFKTFFYVGDPKQSIYRFRGGKRELFDFVAASNSLIKVENLNTNYRSSFNIVNFVNNTFKNIQNYDYIEQNSIKSGGFVKVIQDNNLLNEDKYFEVSKEIENLMQSGINADDIAVLCYTNSDVLELYYYLKEKLPNLKVKTDLSSKLINQHNVKALINLVKYIYFKEDIYKENFNALTQKPLLNSVYSEFNLENRSVANILYEMAKYFNILDENIIKLIESTTWENIVDFIYNIDNLDMDIQNSQDKGLQILTIFKSKGLEFHTVILLDRLKRKNHDKSSLLFDYENINLKNIFYKISNFENFNEDYKLALEKEKNLVLDDEKNVLYVALTRAKNNLIIFKKEKSSVFELLNLQECQIGELILSNAKKIEKNLIKIDYKPLNLGIQEQKIANNKDNESTILKARYFGLATHYVLEMMSSFTLNSLDYSLKLSKARYSNYLDEDDFERVHKIVKNLLENEFFQSLIKDSQIFSEQALSYKEEIKVLDLLLFKDDFYYILDYKTTTDILSEHKYQVKAYKNAISSIFQTNNVKGFLLYLKDDCVEILEV